MIILYNKTLNLFESTFLRLSIRKSANSDYYCFVPILPQDIYIVKCSILKTEMDIFRVKILLKLD